MLRSKNRKDIESRAKLKCSAQAFNLPWNQHTREGTTYF